jgi:hypothetical protein
VVRGVVEEETMNLFAKAVLVAAVLFLACAGAQKIGENFPGFSIPSFTDLVSNQVIRDVVKEVIHKFPADDREVHYDHAKYWFSGANFWARHTVFNKVMGGPNWSDDETSKLTWNQKRVIRTAILNLARIYLRDPGRLLKFYAQKGDIALQAIREQGLQGQYVQVIDKILPNFGPTIPQHILTAIEDEDAAHESWVSAYKVKEQCEAQCHEDHPGAGGGDGDPDYGLCSDNYPRHPNYPCEEQDRRYMEEYNLYGDKSAKCGDLLDQAGLDRYSLQFRLRREAEGGPELVSMWHWMLADFRDALQPPTIHLERP